jgi:ABC-2 type transport system ATP-binding protein
MAIARSLVIGPEILFMDEPTKSLDPSAAEHLKKFIRTTIVGEMGKTVLFATHNLHEAAELSDRIAIIDKAKVRICGTLDEIRKRIKKGFTYRLRMHMGENNVLERIRSLDGVLRAEYETGRPGPDGDEMEIELRDRDAIIPEIIEIIVRSGGRVVECTHEELSLNEIFSLITGGKE